MAVSFAAAIVVSYLRGHLPPWLFEALVFLYVQVYALYLFVLDMIPESLAPQNIIPPLITLLAIYMTLRALYHTTVSFIRSGWFLLKWGTIIVAALCIFTATGNFVGEAVYGPGYQAAWRGHLHFGDYFDSLLSSQVRTGSSYRTRSRTTRSKKTERPPGIFDSFDSHRAYAGRKRSRQTVNDSPVDRVMGQVRDTWRDNGRDMWNTFGRMAGFTESDGWENGQDRRERERPKKLKSQKGQTQATR